MIKKEKDATRKFLITVISKINYISQEMNYLYPADSQLTIEECKAAFIEEMNKYLRNNYEFKGTATGNTSFYIKDMGKNEYKIEFSEERKSIILYLLREDFVKNNISYKQAELIKYHYSEFQKVIQSIKIINTIVSEEKERRKNFNRILCEPESSKLVDISSSSISAVCISNKKNNFYINAFFSELMGYVLISPDGINYYMMFIVLNDCSENMQTIIDVCKNPKQIICDENKVECIQLHLNPISSEKLEMIKGVDDVIENVFG